ncbi:MAG: DegT/DnrJ/EryC1/StrS family aminotransferase [Candidatus Aenigmarchaeota archaeon]|nr:DegT/DnrJ/EryC1/StrS family aminotransferase [Candidatus Aenigmarchaeota archaeon]
MKVPLVDLKIQHSLLKNEIIKSIENIIDTSEFLRGSTLGVFEKDFAKFCGANFCVGCSSGTTALELALRSLNLNHNDEVITVSNTFTATAESIVNVGLTPKFVDIDGNTFNMDVNKIESHISQKTKVILPVHLYGQPSDMKPIMEIAEKHNLIVVEDCAQAHGSEYDGKRVPISDVGCFSFYPAKNLGSFGDAGCIVTNNEKIASISTMLLDHGRGKNKKYEYNVVGFNYRMSDIQAAVLNVKLKFLEDFNKKRIENAKLYNDLLAELKDSVVVPFVAEYSKHVFYVYTIMVRNKKRDDLAEFLKQNEITTQIYYPIPLHLQPAYKNLGYKRGDFPVTEEVCQDILSMPMYPELTEEQIRFVVDKIKQFFNNQI